jgi:hypothetical protein
MFLTEIFSCCGVLLRLVEPYRQMRWTVDENMSILKAIQGIQGTNFLG